MLNEVILQGRLVRDPDMRYTSTCTPVTSFTVAVDRDRKDGNGDRQADFIDCTAWRQTAEFINHHFKKGMLVVIRGRLQVKQWTDNNGNKRSAPEVMVEAVYFGESKRKPDPDERPPFPGDADAPPEVDREGLAQLANAYPGNVQYADPNEKLPWE